MQLNKFTDYALRILMYIAIPQEQPYTITTLATHLQVSPNHAMKIVHFMAKQDWIMTSRGKGGGIRLNPKTKQLKLGNMIKILQGETSMVECNQPPCILRANCGLKGILDQALVQFYVYLDQYTLGEILTPDKAPQSQSHAVIELLNISDL